MKNILYIVLVSLSVTAPAQDIDTVFTWLNDTLEETAIASLHHENNNHIILSWGLHVNGDSLLYASTLNNQGERIWQSALIDSSAMPSAVMYKKGTGDFVVFATQKTGSTSSLLNVFSVSPGFQTKKHAFAIHDQYILKAFQRLQSQTYVLASNTVQNQLTLFRFSDTDSLLAVNHIQIPNENLHTAVSLYANATSDADGLHIIGNTLDRLCMLETDLNGETQWVRYYTNDSIIQGASSVRFRDDYIIAGYSAGFGQNNTGIFLLQVDALGNTTRWSTIGMAGEEMRTYDMKSDGDTALLLTGSKILPNGTYSSFILKTDTLGSETGYWQLANNAEPNELTSIASSGTDAYLVMGTKRFNNFRHLLLGYFGYSPVTAIPFVKAKEIDIYPNPASEYITVTGFERRTKAMIYSTTGHLEMIREFDASTRFQISVHELPAGVYFLLLTDDRDNVYRAKFIKQ